MKKNMKYAPFLLAALLLTACGDASSACEASGSAREEECSAEPAYASGADEAAKADDAAESPDALGLEAEPAADFTFDAVAEDAAKADAALAPEEPLPPDTDGIVPESQSEPVEEPPADDGAQPFVLTAGEWNDNENWGFFANLIHNGTIEFPSYGLDPVWRVAVTVGNGGVPVQNQTVQLKAKDVLWTAKTDKNGNAYLFYDAAYAEQELTLETAGADPVKFTAPKQEAEQGGNPVSTLEMTIETGSASQHYTDTEVCFILDTTGSMGDEITYLQKDFSAIAGEVAADGVTFSVNFYKDKGDSYMTRCNPFTDDVREIQKALNQEYADGGGDTPEAVAEILDEVLVSGDWHAETNKIAFLIFDAPPHSGSKQDAMIHNAVAAAAEKGIHVVPVVASNAERETELFGRALAIMTGSNYVFLTDDSGIGDSHLEPIIGSYEVELLHDIIVRNIREIAG